jgi:hypothetical protein
MSRYILCIPQILTPPVEDAMPGFFKKALALPMSLRHREVLEQIVRRNTSQQQHVFTFA